MYRLRVYNLINLTYVCTWETVMMIKITNMTITPKRFPVPIPRGIQYSDFFIIHISVLCLLRGFFKLVEFCKMIFLYLLMWS